MDKQERIERIKKRAEKVLRRGQSIEEKHSISYEIKRVLYNGSEYEITYELFDTRTLRTFKSKKYFKTI